MILLEPTRMQTVRRYGHIVLAYNIQICIQLKQGWFITKRDQGVNN